ncbi:hypothetical protein [Streptomyces sp. NBC_00658]|uniref:hypothetical protein n=1 Tax=Streptomyces sp. NBC_00658 TaxID=2975800 RepID=UPI00325341A1
MADDATEPGQQDQTAPQAPPQVNPMQIGALAYNAASLEDAQARLQRQLGTDGLTGIAGSVNGLAQVAARLSANQVALDSFQAVTSRSWLREMQAASPLLHGHFEQSMLNLVDASLQELDDLAQDTGESEIVQSDLPDETVQEIEDALSGFEHAVQGLPPAMARRLWISWV